MKFILMITSLILSVSAVAGTGDFGSVGGPRPASVTSTSELLKNGDAAVTIADLCQMLAPKNKNVEWGSQGAQVRCLKTPEGLIEIRAKNNLGSLSVYANASDTLVTQFYAMDDFYKYSNNLGQYLYVSLKSVDEVTDFPERKFHFRPDVLLSSGSSSIQVGYYFQEFKQ